MFLVLSLLAVSILSLIALSSSLSLHALTSFMLVIVYVGAMMVLIGYVCAVTPNITLEPSYSNILAIIFTFFLTFSLSPSIDLSFSTTDITIADYFYSSYGLFTFSLLVLMLFITLLMVTSQYTSPKGPFRSFS